MAPALRTEVLAPVGKGLPQSWGWWLCVALLPQVMGGETGPLNPHRTGAAWLPGALETAPSPTSQQA